MRGVSSFAVFAVFYMMLTMIFGCGGAAREVKPVGQVAADKPAQEEPARKETSTGLPACQRPIGGPAEVWPRIEAARAMSVETLAKDCGLAFIEEVSGWRPPPVDLLAPIVADAKERGILETWVKEKLVSAPRVAEHVVAMDIIGGWQIGGETTSVEQNAGRWREALGDQAVVAKVVAEAEQLTRLLPKVTEVHELRCQIEVNPLGFAVNCVPIHPQQDKIDLTWNAKMQDGLLEDLTLTRCELSRNCKKLKETAATLKSLYRALMKDVDQLEVETFKQQIKAWLVLPPFK